EPFDGGERSLAPPAGVAVMDEAWFEDWLEDVDERMMDYAVAKVALADHARLRITQHELLQWSGTIRFGTQLITEKRELIRMMCSEALHCRISRFVPARLLVRYGQVLQ